MLKIYNSLTGKKNIFKPRKKGRVQMFVCGPTVYDFPHIGHARTYIAFDAFVKYLRLKGYDVFYLQNITDIDDKIINRAKESGITPKELALKFEKQYLGDMKALGVNSVSKYARATAHIKEIISQVRRLYEKGYAYKISDGIYYDISKFKGYGKLSRRTSLQAEDAVSRIDEAKEKRNKGDFCLWKFFKPGEPKWKSEFGYGRPGWHIEDTAITEKFFGPQYDIHGGARDLIFPHHEAEISQMEAISGKEPLVRYWMHTGFLTIEGKKMSKSLGNFITIKDFLEKYQPEILRLLVLKVLWRSPLDYSPRKVRETQSALAKIEEFLVKVEEVTVAKHLDKKEKAGDKKLKALLKKARKDFFLFLDDDFNTPKALSAIFDFIKEANKILAKNKITREQGKEIIAFFKEMNNVFGILDFKKIRNRNLVPAGIVKLAEKRQVLREKKEWAKADSVRKEIEERGFLVEDTQTGFRLKKGK